MSDQQPLLRIVRGDPTADELAALVTVVAARAAAAPPNDEQRSEWADPASRLRRPLPHGDGGWRRSALPH